MLKEAKKVRIKKMSQSVIIGVVNLASKRFFFLHLQDFFQCNLIGKYTKKLLEVRIMVFRFHSITKILIHFYIQSPNGPYM